MKNILTAMITAFFGLTSLWIVMQLWGCVVNACRPQWGVLGL